MQRIRHNLDRDFSAGHERVAPTTIDHDLRRLLSDPATWGEPPSYGELTEPSVRSRIAKLIVRSALKRPSGRPKAYRALLFANRTSE